MPSRKAQVITKEMNFDHYPFQEEEVYTHIYQQSISESTIQDNLKAMQLKNQSMNTINLQMKN